MLNKLFEDVCDRDGWNARSSSHFSCYISVCVGFFNLRCIKIIKTSSNIHHKTFKQFFKSVDF